MEIIRAKNVSYDYLQYTEEGRDPEVYHAVIDVSLDVAPGQFIAVLGHNGSGKSTLARHLNALLLPTEPRREGSIAVPCGRAVVAVKVFFVAVLEDPRTESARVGVEDGAAVTVVRAAVKKRKGRCFTPRHRRCSERGCSRCRA